jgi:hypothetical protein
MSFFLFFLGISDIFLIMEDWQQHSLEEKVDLENLLLIPSDSYSNESLKEYSEELKKDNIDNSAKTEIKTEEIELNDGEGNAKTFEYFTNGNEEVCQICGLKFGNKAVLKIHNSFVHPEGNKDEQNKNCGRRDESVHEEIEPFKCKKCDYKAKRKSYLKNI